MDLPNVAGNVQDDLFGQSLTNSTPRGVDNSGS